MRDMMTVVEKLAEDIPLDERHHDHPLHGKYEGARECHIKPDWLLIYAKNDSDIVLLLLRTGTHSDLF